MSEASTDDHGFNPRLIAAVVAIGVVAFIALWAIFTTTWPIWVHLIIWLPLAAGLSLLAMRVFKSLLVTAQFRFKASEARHD